ncbi:hypothetical protein Glove_141g28 [Diversispora epigaea]|uniref:Uncharacterized protein n=1 Tax=Diversispora epigaea TaxID=1348612 RepID=A0A397J183_9GLOM|nr:hypothetical protein Glove_141g28 [Diversispora epigaea]
MSSMKSLFITILLVICLHVISSLAEYTFYDPWIITKIAGKRMRPGQKVTLKILSNYEDTFRFSIQRYGSNINKVLAENVNLKVGKNKVTVIIPSGDFVIPSSQYYISIAIELPVETTASFQIGDPGFGLTIYKPVPHYIIKVGNILEARWKGSYVPPGVDKSTINRIYCYFDSFKKSAHSPRSSKLFVDGMDFNFTSGGLDYKLPLDTIPNTLYKSIVILETTIFKLVIYPVVSWLFLNYCLIK